MARIFQKGHFIDQGSFRGGLAGAAWKEYTLNVTATTTNPTFGTVTRNEARWRRVGDSAEIIWNYTQSSGGSSGSGIYLFSLPSGLEIDTDVLTTSTDGTLRTDVVGSATVYNGNQLTGYVRAYDSTNLALVIGGDSVNPGQANSSLGDFATATLSYSFRATVPIKGWAALLEATGSGGVAAAGASSLISTDYTINHGDDGRVLLIDTSSTRTITLPDPSRSGFKVTIKDATGEASSNNIRISRNGSENIDGADGDDIIDEDFTAHSYISDGTDWYRLAVFNGDPIANSVALFGGGFDGGGSNVIDEVQIGTLGNATDFGDLTLTGRRQLTACSSETRAVWAGGAGPLNVIDFVEFDTAANATDFGDLTVARTYAEGASSATRGLFAGGSGNSNVIDYITIATTGNATDFGDLTSGRGPAAGAASPTRAVFSGGFSGSSSNVIDYVTIASAGNAVDFGDLTVARSLAGSCSNETRALIAGGGGNIDVIDFITIATTGNAADFGDLSVGRDSPGAAANTTRGLFAGGDSSSVKNVIDYVTIASAGNAVDFGDLTVARSETGGASNSHGGLQ